MRALAWGGQWTVRSKGTLKTTQVCRGASHLLPHTDTATAQQISSIQIFTTIALEGARLWKYTVFRVLVPQSSGSSASHVIALYKGRRY